MFQAMRAKRNAEQMYDEAHTRVNELTTININLSSSKAKLEQEYSALQGDYDELSKELRVRSRTSHEEKKTKCFSKSYSNFFVHC
jgi:predicted nuclease with TOPRIM domain